MNIYVFLGPTLPAAEARESLDATYLPPAALGDVYRATLDSPFAIGIIDGYFERVPSIWHKEILHALARGIHVFGAASMGALRAAELHPFGMRGVGRVFEAFRAGQLTDDDEVAVAHGDAASDYRATSEAMVNIRATLAAAEQRGVIGAELCTTVLKRAKATFYPERNFKSLLNEVQRDFRIPAEVAALRSFIISSPVNQKRSDALELLERLRQCRERREVPDPVRFELSNSEPWSVAREWATFQPPLTATEDVLPALVAAEVRRLGQRGHAIIASAFARAVVRHFSTGQRAPNTPAADVEELRQTLAGTFDDLVCVEARSSGVYEQVARRAVDKARLVGSQQAEPLPELALPAGYVVDWYLVQIDCSSFGPTLPPGKVWELGLADLAALETEARKELVYSQLTKLARF